MFDFTKRFGLTITRSRNVDPELRMNAAIIPLLERCDLVVDVGANRG